MHNVLRIAAGVLIGLAVYNVLGWVYYKWRTHQVYEAAISQHEADIARRSVAVEAAKPKRPFDRLPPDNSCVSGLVVRRYAKHQELHAELVLYHNQPLRCIGDEVLDELSTSTVPVVAKP